MSISQQWMRTPQAAIALGCSQNHLKRSRDTHGGFLVAGEHYVLGASRSTSILWDVDAIRAAFHYRGLLLQRGEQALKQAVGV
jgi:hypothetical protein